jgi:triosephosphate isomerase
VTDFNWPQSLLLVGFKNYLDQRQTLAWLDQAMRVLDSHGERAGEIELVAAPIFTVLAKMAEIAQGRPIRWGAQNLSQHDYGPFTGEIGGPALAQVGCRYVQIGHSERRRLFQETDQIVADKVAAAFRNGLIPFICVGEAERSDAKTASTYCIAETFSALAEVPESQNPLVVLYEPVWAIGAEKPAEASHVRQVCRAIKEALAFRNPTQPSRVIYGGTAGPGLLSELGDDVDGLGLGRRAHDPLAFARVLEEALRWNQSRLKPR